MSKQGLKIAQEYAATLPRFDNLKDAELSLFAMRDDLLRKMEKAGGLFPEVHIDYSPESLKRLEIWYFKLLKESTFRSTGIEREEFERAISFYFGAVIIKNLLAFQWVVVEFAFGKGRYEIGVAAKLCAVMLNRPRNLELIANNKRQQSLWKEFQRYKIY